MRILVLFPFPMCYFLKWKKCFMEGLKCTSKFWIFNKLKTKIIWVFVFSSVQFSRSVVSNSLWPRGLQHARPPCASPTPGVHSNSRPLSQWCHPTISSSFVPFSSCLQSFPASGSFLMRQLFASGGQSTGVSASTWVLPMNTQDWSLGWKSVLNIHWKDWCWNSNTLATWCKEPSRKDL